MDGIEVQERPRKKRRFFVDDHIDDELNTTLTQQTSPQSILLTNGTVKDDNGNETGSFDESALKSIVGVDVDPVVLTALQETFGHDLQGAINAFFDGSYLVSTPRSRPPPLEPAPIDPKGILSAKYKEDSHVRKLTSDSPNCDGPKPRMKADISLTPARRYIGAFGVAGWTTKSGTGLLKAGDVVKIERTRQQVPQKIGKGGKIKQTIRRTQDVIVRFTNTKGDEIGRLEKDSALWVSALIDQKVCHFEGSCIFAPDRLRTNDTVYLQLRAYLLRSVFQAGNFIKPLDNNRETGIFEVKETQDERDLRYRQIGLVKLFSEVNLHPSRTNETTAKHKREGILQAAEMAEQYDQSDRGKVADQQPSSNGGSSPPSEEQEDGEVLEQDQLDSLYKKAQSFDFDTPEVQPAETFALELRKYQKQALHWMLAKETKQKQEHKEQSMHPLWEEYSWPTEDADEKPLPSVQDQDCFYVNPYSGELSLDFPVQEQDCLGGILADEMGLGKTIEMLSLIHTHLSAEQQAAMSASRLESVNALPRLPKNTANIEPAPATTLVVAPMSLLAQWASEAEKASKPGSLRIQLYYGNDRNVNLQTLCSAANVATAPNVIITSYGTVLSEFNAVAAAGGNRGSHGGLFSIEYWRIILDEAHMIKNRQSKTAKACYELAATHRWTLTGTPIVNRLEDLFSLVRFLRVEPWSNFSFWKTFITTPFEKGEFVRALDVVQTILEPLVMRRTKDMKTPTGEALVPLPAKTIKIEKVELSDPERDVYNHIFARAKRTFNANVEAGTLMKSYTTIFAQILRLRQSCCHPILTRNKQIVAEEEDAAAAADIANGLADDMDLSALLERFSADDGEQDASKFGTHVLEQIQNEASMECPICSEEPMNQQAVTGCWHSACKDCLMDYIDHQVKKGELPRCFNCREPINTRDVFEVVRHEDESTHLFDEDEELYSSTQERKVSKTTTRVSLRRINALSSAKIKTLIAQLRSLRNRDPLMKTVVFSQFTSFLDLLAPALTQANINWLRFDGTMQQKERARVLAEFAERPKFTILLLSLRAGGVGLNLTCAKQVYMMVSETRCSSNDVLTPSS